MSHHGIFSTEYFSFATSSHLVLDMSGIFPFSLRYVCSLILALSVYMFMKQVIFWIVHFCRPYIGELLPEDPAKRLALLKPRLPNGKCPPGFRGFAVNMINVDCVHLSCLTASGHGLRETLFYSLFSRVQVYETRDHMQDALPCISDGAISLDGGIMRNSGLFFLGNR